MTVDNNGNKSLETMGIQTREQLKRWFSRGQYPTESQFGDLIDSMRHNGEAIDMTAVEGLAAVLNGKAERTEAEAAGALAREAREEATRLRNRMADLEAEMRSNLLPEGTLTGREIGGIVPSGMPASTAMSTLEGVWWCPASQNDLAGRSGGVVGVWAGSGVTKSDGDWNSSGGAIGKPRVVYTRAGSIWLFDGSDLRELGGGGSTGESYTREESDGLYMGKTSAYTKEEADAKFAAAKEVALIGNQVNSHEDIINQMSGQVNEMSGTVDDHDRRIEALEQEPGGMPIVVQTEAAVTIQPDVLNKWGEVASLTINFAAGSEGYAHEYCMEFVSGSTATTLSLPEAVKFPDEPTIEANMRYQISIVNNIALIAGVPVELGDAELGGVK